MNFNTLFNKLLNEARDESVPSIPLKWVVTGKDRKGNEKGEWLNLDGTKPPLHVRKVYINPKFKNVKYNPDPRGAKIFSATSDKGNATGAYSKKHREKSAANKYKRIKKLNSKLSDGSIIKEKILSRIDKSDLDKCIALIMYTALRVGSSNENDTYGASNLEARHIIIDGGSVHLDFIGKKKVRQQHEVEEPIIKKMLIALKNKAMKTPLKENARLFSDDVTEPTCLAFMKKTFGARNKVHDLRTLIGTNLAITEIKKIEEMPTTKKEYKALVKQVAESVSRKLGNTPSAALTSYIDPNVFKDWKESAGLLTESMQNDDYVELYDDEDVDISEIGDEPDEDYPDEDYPELDDAEIGEVTPTLINLLGFDPRTI